MATLVIGQMVFDMMDVPKKQPPFLLFKKVVNSRDAGDPATVRAVFPNQRCKGIVQTLPFTESSLSV